MAKSFFEEGDKKGCKKMNDVWILEKTVYAKNYVVIKWIVERFFRKISKWDNEVWKNDLVT